MEKCKNCYLRDAKPCFECHACRCGADHFKPAPIQKPTNTDLRAMSNEEVSMTRISGTTKTFDVSVVDEGYIRIYGGMIAFGRKCGNKRRDEMVFDIEKVKAVIAAHEAALSEKGGDNEH